jgi:hypothetical protein
MKETLGRLLDARASVYAAALLSLVLGLFFIFVWAPHPWGWSGIDFYFELARALARGEEFGTTDVPWGYAYFIAFCHWLFGDRQWAPLVVQAVANATVPIFVFLVVRALASHRTATLAAVLTGALSFNTVYASTLASDSMCTVLFMIGLWTFVNGCRDPRLTWFVISGIIAGLIPQFRPNLILLPFVAALFLLWQAPQKRRALIHATVFLVMTSAALTPWVVRNHRLTGLFLPTSTHGGEQLWYGTLQVGPYLENRALNPRTAFRSAPFDYTSISSQPLIVSAAHPGCPGAEDRLALIYWTDRDPARRTAEPNDARSPVALFEVPAQPDGTVFYHYFESTASPVDDTRFQVPRNGDSNPLVTFISSNHLRDLDTHGDTLDIFDIVRLMRHLAWREPLTYADRLEIDGDGVISERDLLLAVNTVLPEAGRAGPTSFSADGSSATIQLPDASWIRVPLDFGWRQTDIELDGGPLATALVSRWRTYSGIADARERRPPVCQPVEPIGVNRIFYRAEPHTQSRFMALALDNISRTPAQFVMASVYRMFRLFMIRGTTDRSAVQQFESGWLAYGAGQALSLAYVALFLAGAVVAWRRRSALLVLLIPIVYVPVTICVVLTNMRYTVTMQPLMFAFMAAGLIALLKLDERRGETGS